MAVELSGNQILRVKALFDGFPHDKACLEYLLSDPKSRFFADSEQNPSVGFVWHPIQGCFIAGDPGSEALRGLIDYVTDVAGLTFMLISVPSEEWADVIASNFEDLVKYERSSFEFTNSCLEQIQSWHERVPEGYEVRQIDTESAKFIGNVDPVFSWTWPESDDFVRRSIGFCTMHQGQVVSVAWSAFPPNNYMEFAVATLPEHQRKGLCPITCAPLVLYCLSHGIKPIWSANALNEASHKAAEKLGFTKKGNYFWVRNTKRF